MEADVLTFEMDGAQRIRGAAADHLDALHSVLADTPPDQAGVRLRGIAPLDRLLGSDGPIGALASAALKAESKPVRAILFDKTLSANWSLGWHQDRTICVRRRIDTDGFGPWTVKAGMQHVAPPFGILSRMATLRIHLDDVGADNAPLLVAPGSHTVGRVPVGDIDEVVRRCGAHACLAKAGDIWLYATPILHASEAAVRPARRRVLQLDYAAEALPGGLEWLGV
jgi:hypothetical protein